MPRYRAVVDVHLLLLRNGQVLLGERQHTGYEDGKFHLPAGHLEAGESLVDALRREAREELGVRIDPADVTLAHLLHHHSAASGQGRVAVFFAVRRWQGEPQNLEPDKCARLAWFSLDRLPSNLVPYARHALAQVTASVPFSLYGWEHGDRR